MVFHDGGARNILPPKNINRLQTRFRQKSTDAMNVWQHVPNIRYCNFYVNDLTTDTIPAITSSISAI